MRTQIDETKHLGRKSGLLTIIKRAGTKNKMPIWTCRCACGNTVDLPAKRILGQYEYSCGCTDKPGRDGRGFAYHPLYATWQSMFRRCGSKDTNNYKYYKAKGITVCKEWDKMKNFVAWAEGKYAPGLELDRRDNDKGYSPENCRFVTKQINANNKNYRKGNTMPGVISTNSGKFKVVIFSNSPPLNGKLKQLGTFNTKEQAIVARNNFIKKHKLLNKPARLN